MTADQLTAEDCAALVGVTVETWHSYVSRGVVPEPAGRLGRTPWWTPAQITQWQAGRPGRGAGGGRPKKKEQGHMRFSS